MMGMKDKSCPLCSAGHVPTRRYFIPLEDDSGYISLHQETIIMLERWTKLERLIDLDEHDGVVWC